MSRVLTPAEKTHLARFAPEALGHITKYGEMPVEYISGVAEFCGMLFDVTSDVLIPRLETEELVELALREIKSLPTVKSSKVCIAEIGTGCGAVAICLSNKLQSLDKRKSFKFKIVASDISEAALKVARANAQKLVSNYMDQADKLAFIASDLFYQFPRGQVFDIIIANLPYIPQERIDYLDSSVKDFEPRVALDGGPSGLDLIKRMIKQAETRTKPGSVILLEVDYTHTAVEFDEFMPEWNVETVIDQFYRQRFVKLIKK